MLVERKLSHVIGASLSLAAKLLAKDKSPGSSGASIEPDKDRNLQVRHGDIPTLPFPPGHFYSPIVDPTKLNGARVWPANPTVPGIDFNGESHRAILKEAFPRFIRDYDFPDTLPEAPGLDCFFTQNSQFSGLDACALFVLLRAWAPRRVIEVGSGYSSLLMANVNHRYLDDAIDVTCIEPYPRAFIEQTIPGIKRHMRKEVQDVGLEEFERLEAGDVLFVDSSHVAKTGSDVNFLFFEVFPRLAAGVNVHIHDIFLPHDYPPAWVLDENRSWNEQYLLRALLLGGDAFKVVFGCSYACHYMPDLVRTALARPDGALHGGGSFWIRRAERPDASQAAAQKPLR